MKNTLIYNKPSGITELTQKKLTWLCKISRPSALKFFLKLHCLNNRHIPLYQSSMFHFIYHITQNLYILFIMAGKYNGFSFFL